MITPVLAEDASGGASGRLVYCQTQAGDTQIPPEAREVARLGPDGPVVFTMDRALVASAREVGFRFSIVKGASQTGGLPVSAANDDGFVIGQQAGGTLSNEYVTIVIDENGVFTMRRTGDDAKLLFGLDPWSSVMTVKVDGTAVSTDAGLTASRPLHVDTQAGTANVEYTLGGVKFVHRFELAGPAVRFRMTVTNNDSGAHQVAVRYLLDTQIADNDGAPISAEGVVDSSGSSVITYETEVTDVWFTEWKDYDRWPNPTLVEVGTIESIPSRMVFVYWGNAYGTVYDYVHDPQLRFYTPEGQTPPFDPNDPNTWDYYCDSTVLIYFDLGTLPAGGTTEVTTAYGLGTPTSGGPAQVLRNLRFAVASYHRGAIHSIASGDVGLAKRIHADSGLKAMLEEFAEDIQASGALLNIVAKVLKNPLLAESRAWMQAQIKQLAGSAELEAGAWILDHVED